MPYQDVMNTILPHQGGRDAHITGHYGEHRAKGPHGGSDFNYEGGQTGINLTHPTVHSPVAGEVTFVGGQYGTIKVRDAQGNSHEILHTQSQSVKVGQHLEAGDEIGRMGGRGPDGASQYAQHVHYQMKDAHGHAINPETFWRDREAPHAGRHPTSAPHRAAAGHHEGHTLREDARGGDVQTLQERLNALGVRDAQGHALTPDGRFGTHTKEAVEAFQREHGLKADGIVGPRTTEALQKAQAHAPASLDHASHPGNGHYTQARDGVHRIDAAHQRTPDERSERLAAALTAEAQKQGLQRIDHVTLSDDGRRAYAMQGEADSPFKKVAEVDVARAVATPVAESSHAWQDAAQQEHVKAAQQGQAQQQQQQHQHQEQQSRVPPGH
ncbi:Peptidase family M23 [Luteibacter sp. UNCMF331Sha3.1]|nr:Peptidase family M23 [Luteibacter sp. UNCMF331Sha3.1]